MNRRWVIEIMFRKALILQQAFDGTLNEAESLAQRLAGGRRFAWVVRNLDAWFDDTCITVKDAEREFCNG